MAPQNASEISSFPRFVPTSTRQPLVTAIHTLSVGRMNNKSNRLGDECESCISRDAFLKLEPCGHKCCYDCVKISSERSLSGTIRTVELECPNCLQKVNKFLPVLPSKNYDLSGMNALDEVEDDCTDTDTVIDTSSDALQSGRDIHVLPISVDCSSDKQINLIIKPKHEAAPSTIMLVSPEMPPISPTTQSETSYKNLLKSVYRKLSTLTSSDGNSMDSLPKMSVQTKTSDTPRQLFRAKTVPTTPITNAQPTTKGKRTHGKSYSVNACFEIIQVNQDSPTFPGSAELIRKCHARSRSSLSGTVPKEMFFELP